MPESDEVRCRLCQTIIDAPWLDGPKEGAAPWQRYFCSMSHAATWAAWVIEEAPKKKGAH